MQSALLPGPSIPVAYSSQLGNQDCLFTTDSSCHTLSRRRFSFQSPMATQEPVAVVTLSPPLQTQPWYPHGWLVFPLLLQCYFCPQICGSVSSGIPRDLLLMSPGAFLHKLHWTSKYVYGMFKTFGLFLMGSSQMHVLIPFLLGQRLVIAQVSKQISLFFHDDLVHWYHGLVILQDLCLPKSHYSKKKLVFLICWSAVPLPQLGRSLQ